MYCFGRVRPCLDNDGSRCSLCFIITKNWHLKRPYAFVTTRLLVLHMGITNQTLTFLRSPKCWQSVFLHFWTLNILWLVNHTEWLLMLAISLFYFNTGNKLKFRTYVVLKDEICNLELLLNIHFEYLWPQYFMIVSEYIFIFLIQSDLFVLRYYITVLNPF